MRTVTKFWIGLAVLIILSPLGLLPPERFRASAAWGEWSAEEMRKLMGYIPRGLEKLSTLWSAPVRDYTFTGWEGPGRASLAYAVSALIGVTITVAIALIIGKLLSKKR